MLDDWSRRDDMSLMDVAVGVLAVVVDGAADRSDAVDDVEPPMNCCCLVVDDACC